MDIIVVGLNHNTAPVEVREKLAIPNSRLSEVLKMADFLQERVILSTCNRVEVYGIGNHSSIVQIKQFLADLGQVNIEEFEASLYTHSNRESVRHLFEVACGLDSMVLGENEILGQIKTVYLLAHQYKATGKILNVLFQKSLGLGKKVRILTEISKGSISVGSVAVDLAKKIFGNLADKKVMIIGAGKMSETTTKHLISHGVATILVSNRTFERAQELAETFHGQAIRFDDYLQYLEKVDIVISSTGAPHHIITKEALSTAMPRRRQKPLFFIDIAVPRDIEPDVNKIDNVYLYDIDDLQQIVESNMMQRKREVEKCNYFISEKTNRFMEWFSSLKG